MKRKKTTEGAEQAKQRNLLNKLKPQAEFGPMFIETFTRGGKRYGIVKQVKCEGGVNSVTRVGLVQHCGAALYEKFITKFGMKRRAM